MSRWTLQYDRWDPAQQPLREALCTLGNGFFATRGAAEEADAGGPHYPGTYIAGAYDRLTTEISGRPVENEDLVNWPNWLRIDFRHEDGEWFRLADCEVLKFHQELDLKRGVLERRVRFRDGGARTSILHSRRFTSMAQPHLAGIEWTLTPEDWSGPIRLRSMIDGDVVNAGVDRYRDLAGRHVDVLGTDRPFEEVVRLTCRTVQSKLRVSMAARHRLLPPPGEHGAEGESGDGPVRCTALVESDRVGHEFRLVAREGERTCLEKICAVFTQRDLAISEPAHEAARLAASSGSFEQLLHEHEPARAKATR